MKKKAVVAADELLTTEDAAKVAGKSAKTILRWFDAGLITGEAVRTGSRRLVRVSRLSLETFLQSR